MDPIVDVLRTIKLSGVIFLRANLGGQYGIEMPPPTFSHPTVKPLTAEHRLAMFHIVRDGEGYVEFEGSAPRKLATGDLILVFDHITHSMVDCPGRAKVKSTDLLIERFTSAAPPAVEVGEGPRTMRLVCGMLQFVERGFNPIIDSLPPFLHIPQGRGPSTPWLRANIDHVVAEAEAGRPGSDTVMSRLTEILFVETLRGYLGALPPSERGWFAALKDPIVGAGIRLIHQSPAHPWTVAELAKKSGASRSAFSARFTELLDTSPIAYLTEWRIRLATNLLAETDQPIAGIASEVGYESESAFNRAFKREMGATPAAWRNAASQ